MSQVSTDSKVLDALQMKLLDETSLLNELTRDLEDKYDELGVTWCDSNYAALGDILISCVRACRNTARELDLAREMLNGLLSVAREYENADVGSMGNAQTGEYAMGSGLAGGANNVTFPLIAREHMREEDLALTNPGCLTNEKRQINCQRCVPAYIMRRRGYDVQAREMPSLSPFAFDYLSYHPEDAWVGADILTCSGTGMNEIISQMLTWGEGAQAEIAFDYRDTDYGHVFVVEVVNGEVVFSDPQLPSQNATEHFRNAEPGSTIFWRVDTLEPSELIYDCCEGVSR